MARLRPYSYPLAQRAHWNPATETGASGAGSDGTAVGSGAAPGAEAAPSSAAPAPAESTNYLTYLPIVGGLLQSGMSLQDYRLQLADTRGKIAAKEATLRAQPWLAFAIQGDITKLRAREAELVALAAESQSATATRSVVMGGLAFIMVTGAIIGTSWGVSVLRNRRLAAQIQVEELKRLRAGA